MKTIGSRLRAARKKCELTLKDVNESIGISTGNLSELENDIKQPSSQTLIALKKLYNISIDWVLTGEITEYNDTYFELTHEERYDLDTFIDFLKFRREGNIICKNSLSYEKSKKGLSTYPITAEKDSVTYLPVIEDITTVISIESIEAYKGDISNSFIIRARGDSMIDAGIEDGDLVIFRAQPMVENGEIALVNVKGESSIRYFYLDNEKCELRSANPEYPPEKYSIDEINIIGKFVEVLEHK